MSIILQDVKQSLGIAESITGFDSELSMHIERSFLPLDQAGALLAPVAITTETTWDDIIKPIDATLQSATFAVKQYIFTDVKLVFDPPQPSVIAILQEVKNEMLERAIIAYSENDRLAEVV